MRLLLLYLFLLLAGTLLCILSFHTPLPALTDVFFYRGLLLIVFWGLVITLCMLLFKLCRGWREITVRDLLLLFIAFCSVHILFFTHVPVTAERSVTVFMLGYMADQPEKTFTEEEITEYFISRYVGDFGAFTKRLHEQEETGTIVRDGDGYRITGSGKALMKLYEAVADVYGIDRRLIHSGGG